VRATDGLIEVIQISELRCFRYSARLNYDVACPMDFHRFPVDNQLCEVNFESFGYTTDELRFAWLRNGSTVNANITLAQFGLDVVLEDTYATDYYDLAYPGIIMKLYLNRVIGYHVVQTYIPSMVLVVLAWLSLFISPESVPGEKIDIVFFLLRDNSVLLHL
jgi:hypothetical protein